ncbi:MAG TPA: RsmB/NOP family class I SAM-dependent RNA methyltransferase [Methylomirabilota bacterium]|nr:RsmB/NOP family class I SAM-dependent RNA methyltransferase [Methylomirabilota bacterium]
MQNTYQNLPEKFLERLKKLYGEKELKMVLQAIATKPLPSFRTNTLKITTVELTKMLRDQAFIIEAIPWYHDAFLLKNRSIRELTETAMYKQGFLYIQNLSSIIPSLVLAPKPQDKILDLCAAPGSKTTHIASLMANSGEIVANDLSRQRLYKLSANLIMYGITTIKTLNIPGQTLWKKFPEYFDKTLVDVPCSMEGRIVLSDPESYQDWKLGKIKELATKQKYLLRSAISATKVGGTIVYSTCTLAPEENEGVIDWILKKEGNAVAVEKIEIDKLDCAPGITSWNKPYNPQVAKTSRILPSTTMEGFFVAKLRKKKSTLSSLLHFPHAIEHHTNNY